MAPTVNQLSVQLRQIIYYHLDNNLLTNAVFLAERLHGLEPRSPEAVYLLALCHQRLGQVKTAYDYSRLLAAKGTHLGCAYVFAQVSLVLEKPAEGIAALERARPLWEGRNSLNKHSETSRRPAPDAAAIHCLLGKLFEADTKMERAIYSYVEALKLNPFMWDAFERLCHVGANMRTTNIFKATPELLAAIAPAPVTNSNSRSQVHDISNGLSRTERPSASSRHQMATPGTDPFTSLGTAVSSFASRANLASTSSVSPGLETPPSQGSQDHDIFHREIRGPPPPGNPVEPPNAPSRRTRVAQALGAELNLDSSRFRLPSSRPQARPASADTEPAEAAGTTYPNQYKRTISGSISQSSVASNPSAGNAPQRRSRRLFGKPPPPPIVPAMRDASELRKAKATGTKGRVLPTSAVGNVGRVVSGNRKPVEVSDNLVKEVRHQISNVELAPLGERQPVDMLGRDHEALQWLLDLLGRLGQGLHALRRYQCQEALHHFNGVPHQQRETPWVLAQIGRAQYEQGKYVDAETTFSRIQKKVPSRMEDMEIYSTVLWHLKNDTELAFLSHELVDADRSSPQAWCTIGNSFSLQRDHDQALKCFKRATQLDPKFAYGYTLQGHEYSSNEEYVKALQAYRKAICADHRHYNGWYGMAKVYEKLGKYDMAENHYRAATSINPTNAVLIWSIGMVLEKLKQPKKALLQYRHACDLAPTSAMPRFKKARILLNLQRYEEALDEFNILKDMVPDESNVHFMLGRVHKQLNNKSEAVKHFTIALNLDPKAAPYIKETMESIDQEDEEGSDDDESMT